MREHRRQSRSDVRKPRDADRISRSGSRGGAAREELAIATIDRRYPKTLYSTRDRVRAEAIVNEQYPQRADAYGTLPSGTPLHDLRRTTRKERNA